MHHGVRCVPFVVGVAVGMALYYILFPYPLIVHIGYKSRYIPEDVVVQRLLDTFYAEQEKDFRHLRDQIEIITPDAKPIILKDSATASIRNIEDTVKVHCVVFINEHYGLGLATAAAETWVRRCSSWFFIGRAANQSTPYPIIHSNHSFYTSITDAKKAFNEAVSYVRNKRLENNDWFLFSTDTAFVILENLRLFLMNHNSSELIYAGEISKTANGFMRPFLSGGIVFSKASLRSLNLSAVTSCIQKTYELTKNLCLLDTELTDATPLDRHGQSLMNILPVKLLMKTKISQNNHVLPSSYTVSMRFLSSHNMYSYEMLVYSLNPYGINQI